MIYKPSNLIPNLREIDGVESNSFSCQVNTSGEPVKAYRLKVLSARGDKTVYDSEFVSAENNYYYTPWYPNDTLYANENDVNPTTHWTYPNSPIYSDKYLTNVIMTTSSDPDISGQIYFNNYVSGKPFNVFNKLVLTTLPIPANELKNGNDYQWNIRVYNAANDSGKPNTKVCDGFITGSTKQVFWCRIENPDNIVDVTTKTLTQQTLDQLVYDRYIQLPLSGIINNAKEEDDPPTRPTTPERKKIEWVDKNIGINENMVKIETSEQLVCTYKDGAAFEIYLCPSDHTVTSAYADPNSEIIQSYYMIIYNNYAQALEAARASETPSDVKDTSRWGACMKKIVTVEGSTTPETIWRARKITGYSQDTGEIRITDAFNEPPVNGQYYRLFQYNTSTKQYTPIDDVKFENDDPSGEIVTNNLKGHQIGGQPVIVYNGETPFSPDLFKVFSNKWSDNVSERRIFIQPNINIKTDSVMCDEVTFKEDSSTITLTTPLRFNIRQHLDANEKDVTINTLDNTQWLLEGFNIDIDDTGGLTTELLNAYLVNQRNYEVYTNFMDSMPNCVCYARATPEITIWAKNYVDVNANYEEINHITGSTEPDVDYQDIAFKPNADDMPPIDADFIDRIKYYKYQIFSGNKTTNENLIAESQEIYNTELTWYFRGLEADRDYTVVLTITDEYDKVFTIPAYFTVDYVISNSPDTLQVRLECHEEAMQIISEAPIEVESIDMHEDESNPAISTVLNEDISEPENLHATDNKEKRYLHIPTGISDSGITKQKILNYTRTTTDGSPIEIDENFILRSQFRITDLFARTVGDDAFKRWYVNSGTTYYNSADYSHEIGTTTEETEVEYNKDLMVYTSDNETRYYLPVDAHYELKEAVICELARPRDSGSINEYFMLTMTPVNEFFGILQSGNYSGKVAQFDSNLKNYYIIVDGNRKVAVPINEAAKALRFYSNGREIKYEDVAHYGNVMAYDTNLIDQMLRLRVYRCNPIETPAGSGHYETTVHGPLACWDNGLNYYDLTQSKIFNVAKHFKYVTQSREEYVEVTSLPDDPILGKKYVIVKDKKVWEYNGSWKLADELYININNLSQLPLVDPLPKTYAATTPWLPRGHYKVWVIDGQEHIFAEPNTPYYRTLSDLDSKVGALKYEEEVFPVLGNDAYSFVKDGNTYYVLPSDPETDIEFKDGTWMTPYSILEGFKLKAGVNDNTNLYLTPEDMEGGVVAKTLAEGDVVEIIDEGDFGVAGHCYKVILDPNTSSDQQLYYMPLNSIPASPSYSDDKMMGFFMEIIMDENEYPLDEFANWFDSYYNGVKYNGEDVYYENEDKFAPYGVFYGNDGKMRSTVQYCMKFNIPQGVQVYSDVTCETPIEGVTTPENVTVIGYEIGEHISVLIDNRKRYIQYNTNYVEDDIPTIKLSPEYNNIYDSFNSTWFQFLLTSVVENNTPIIHANIAFKEGGIV